MPEDGTIALNTNDVDEKYKHVIQQEIGSLILPLGTTPNVTHPSPTYHLGGTSEINLRLGIPLRAKTTFHVGSRSDVKTIDVVSEGIPRRVSSRSGKYGFHVGCISKPKWKVSLDIF
ncbi:hypothetical protein QL285_010646 [Trifolium repens]|nr:hypothetical protein QL285_010646 [Trifolium repens]